MAQNFVHKGKVLNLTAPRTVTSGNGVKVGNFFGIALGDYTSGDTLCPFAVEGVWDIPGDGSVIAQGGDVYWDNSAFKATSTAGSNLMIGQAEVAAAAPDTTIRVKLGLKPFVLDMSAAGVTASAAEINVLDAAVAGTAKASLAVVLNAAKSIDLLQATTALSVGGTGVPGAALVQTQITKTVTGLVDTVATPVMTVTVPNAKHAALIDIDILGILGAGGAIGAGESVILAKYQVVLARTAGVAVVPAISSAIGGQKCVVASGNAMTSVVLTLSTITGANSASQTFTVNAAITKAAGAADNHVAVISARIVNANATGVTIV